MRDIRYFNNHEIIEIVKIDDYYKNKPYWIEQTFTELDYICLEKEVLNEKRFYAFVLLDDRKIKGITKEFYDELNRVFNFDKKASTKTNTSLIKHNSMKIDVLGTKYDVELLDERDESMKALNADGYTDFSIKSIKILKNKEEDATKQKDLMKYQNMVFRHELIHAFLYECGIDSGMQFHNEECVDFFAMQFGKLEKIFKDAGCKE